MSKSERIDHDTKTICIRWHGLRKYQGTEIVGMRGFPQREEGGSERYELEYKDGQWRCDYLVADIGHGIGYDPIFRMVAQNENLYIVIKACEEHAYTIYMRAQEFEGDNDTW